MFYNQGQWGKVNSNVTDEVHFWGFLEANASKNKDTILIKLSLNAPSIFNELKIKLFKKEFYTSYELIYPVDGELIYYAPRDVKLIFKNDPYNIEGEIKGYIEFELREIDSKLKGYFKCNVEK